MEAKFSAPDQAGPGAHQATCTLGTGFFPGVNSGRGVTLTSHPLLVPWSRKSRAIPLLPLWAVRPIQSLSACVKMHFTLPYLTYLRANLPSGLFPSVLPTKTPYAPLFSLIRATCPDHLILPDFTTRIICGKEYRALSF